MAVRDIAGAQQALRPGRNPLCVVTFKFVSSPCDHLRLSMPASSASATSSVTSSLAWSRCAARILAKTKALRRLGAIKIVARHQCPAAVRPARRKRVGRPPACGTAPSAPASSAATTPSITSARDQRPRRVMDQDEIRRVVRQRFQPSRTDSCRVAPPVTGGGQVQARQRRRRTAPPGPARSPPGRG